MEEPGSKASVRSRDGIQGNVLLYIGFYNNANHNIVCVHDIDFWTCSADQYGGRRFNGRSCFVSPKQYLSCAWGQAKMKKRIVSYSC